MKKIFFPKYAAIPAILSILEIRKFYLVMKPVYSLGTNNKITKKCLYELRESKLYIDQSEENVIDDMQAFLQRLRNQDLIALLLYLMLHFYAKSITVIEGEFTPERGESLTFNPDIISAVEEGLKYRL